MPTVSTRVQDVRARRPQAKIGAPVEGNYLNRIGTLINKDPQASQVSAVVVDTATNSHVYTITINGIDVSYTADGATTKPEIADGLALAVNAEPMVRGQVTASSDGIDTVSLTGNEPGVAFTLDESDAKLSHSTSTTAAVADSVGFGLLVISGGFQTDEANELGSLAKDDSLTAQVDTLTVDYAAAELYTVEIEVDGRRYIAGPVLADTDDATTATAIRAAINAIMPADTVIATGATDQVILTAEVEGKAFLVSIGLKTGTTARLALVHTTSGRSTDVNKVAAGVSVYTTDEEVTTIGGTTVVYPANAGMMVMSDGLIWVENSESPTKGDDVYVELNSGSANCGKFFKTSSSTRVRLTGFAWDRAERSTQSDGIAVLKVAI